MVSDLAMRNLDEVVVVPCQLITDGHHEQDPKRKPARSRPGIRRHRTPTTHSTFRRAGILPSFCLDKLFMLPAPRFQDDRQKGRLSAEGFIGQLIKRLELVCSRHQIIFIDDARAPRAGGLTRQDDDAEQQLEDDDTERLRRPIVVDRSPIISIADFHAATGSHPAMPFNLFARMSRDVRQREEPQPDHLAIWHQLSLRHNCLINWVKDTLDLDVQAAQQEDQNNKNDALAIELNGDPTNLDPDPLQLPSGSESDEQSSLGDQDDSSSDTEQLFSFSDGDSDDQADPDPNESYVTTLNDADQNSSQESSEDEEKDELEDKKRKDQDQPLSLDNIESHSSSSASSSKNTHKHKHRRSAVDSDFFSLAESE
ncbi:hypothetical protein PtA15_16A221 [Puccinia triticina]|uniref:Uncharacterized protein n=1 Tax=Puccinia triticina TaxID=208348 RepID=A0ABY7D8G2_9BASI|nr:uncharacterized protein PtA15_16A221 [Puccinia triticina]WAQ92315.1 hypothetical protein PtA15_16A221 [Puccinia triticina]